MRPIESLLAAALCMSLGWASPARADGCQCAGWTLDSKEEPPGKRCDCDQVCKIIDDIEEDKANIAIYRDEGLITAALNCFNALPEGLKKRTSPANLVTPIAQQVFSDWSTQYVSCCKGRPWLVGPPERLPDKPGPGWCPPLPGGSDGPTKLPQNVTVNMDTFWGTCTTDSHGYEKTHCTVQVRGSCTHELTHCAQCRAIHSPSLWPSSDQWLAHPVFEARSEWLAYEAGMAARQQGVEELAKSCGLQMTCKRPPPPPPDAADQVGNLFKQYVNLSAGGFL